MTKRTPVKKQQAKTPAKAATPAATGQTETPDESVFEGYYEWEIEADEATTNQLTALFCQRDQINMKVVRVQKALAAARNQVSLPLLKTYMKNIEAAYTEFSAVHSKVMAILPRDMIDKQEEVYTSFENRFNFVNATIEELMLAHQQPPAVQVQQQQPQVIIQQQPLKAPIPTFNGDYASWPKFKAIFEDLMANSGDSDAIKLYHLDKALVGEAAGVLDAKVISEGDYQQAWTILTDRFENKRIIVETHIRGLFGLQKMASETYKELRRLLDECIRHVESLKYLDQNFDGVSELFVVHLLTNALDKATRKAWESSQKKGELPRYAQTISFLQSRCQILENCEMAFETTLPSSSRPKVPVQPKLYSPKVHAAALTPTEKESCVFCKGPHFNHQCGELSSMPFAQRMEKVRSSGVCYNCLRKGHCSKECQSPRSCRKCQKRHHTLLHNDEVQRDVQSNVMTSEQQNQPNTPREQPKTQSVKQVSRSPSNESLTSTACSCNYVESSKTVFLLTAVVNAQGKDNQPHACRVLLDSGSQVNFVTDKFARVLGLPKQRVSIPICGIGNTKTVAREKMLIRIKSRLTDYEAPVDCLVTSNVAGTIPPSNIDVSAWTLPLGIQLADPDFYQPDKIDMLIGAELFFKLMRPGCINTGDEFPELRETHLGWVVAGALRTAPNTESLQHSFAATVENIDESMQRFWMLEAAPISSESNEEEQVSENHFTATHERVEDGLSVVKPQFKENMEQLNDCRAATAPFIATRCLQQVAEDQAIEFPGKSSIVKEDANTLSKAKDASKELEGILGKGTFAVRKRCSSSKEFLEHILKAKQKVPVILEAYALPEADELLITKPSHYNAGHPITNRMIYPEVAKLFHPLGLAAPAIVVAKLLVQQLCKCRTGWDDPVDETIERCWVRLDNSLPALNRISILRRVTVNNTVSCEMHGNADASSAAYDACVYAGTRLLYMQKVILDMKMTFSNVVRCSNSQIVLTWMKKLADQLKVFVHNRINSSTVGYRWCYIRSKDNSADIASRGQLQNELSTNSLSWSGPTFLRRSEYAEEEKGGEGHPKQGISQDYECRDICVYCDFFKDAVATSSQPGGVCSVPNRQSQ